LQFVTAASRFKTAHELTVLWLNPLNSDVRQAIRTRWPMPGQIGGTT
jgi:hypothetical protein